MRFAHINPAHAECRSGAQGFDREDLLPVPFHRKGGEMLGGEVARHVADRRLLLAQLEGKPCAHRHSIVGMTKLAPSFTPEGQREVTVLVLV